MPRDKSVLLRLTEQEHARLKELAGREPVASYLRRVALGEDQGPRTPAAEKELKAAYESEGLADQFKEATYGCPMKDCGFIALSSKARCPHHNRLVV